MKRNKKIFKVYATTEYNGQNYIIKKNKKTKEKIVVLEKKVVIEDRKLVDEILAFEKQESPKALAKMTTRGLVGLLIIQELLLAGGTKNWELVEPVVIEMSPYEDNKINEDMMLSSEIGEYPTLETAYLGQILDHNKNIKDEKEIKEVFKNYMSIYISENPYFDYDLAYARFLTLGIIENTILNVVDKVYNRGSMAFYMPTNNTIHLMDPTNREESYVLFHELLHSVTFRNLDINYNCKFLTEGMTALLTLEYTANEYKHVFNISDWFNSEQSNSYTSYTMICKILCELLGEDIMLKAYSTSDYNLLIEKMNGIIGDKKTKEVFECLSKYSDIVEEQSSMSDEACKLADNLVDYFKLIYEEKYGYDSEENDILNDYYHVLQKPYSNSAAVKFYYNSKLKKMYPASYIIKIDYDADHQYIYDLNSEEIKLDEYYPGYRESFQYYFEPANDPILYDKLNENSEKQKLITRK